MISSYRLGDLFCGLDKESEAELVADYPNSIGAKYAATTKKIKCIDTMTNIVLEFIQKK